MIIASHPFEVADFDVTGPAMRLQHAGTWMHFAGLDSNGNSNTGDRLRWRRAAQQAEVIRRSSAELRRQPLFATHFAGSEGTQNSSVRSPRGLFPASFPRGVLPLESEWRGDVSCKIWFKNLVAFFVKAGRVNSSDGPQSHDPVNKPRSP